MGTLTSRHHPKWRYRLTCVVFLYLSSGEQLTNILRDVGEDALRGRIYLPMEDLERWVEGSLKQS